MALNNNQKSKIIQIAKEGGYKGDYVDLFQQAEKEDVFEEKEVSGARKEDFKLNTNSLLVDKTPHTFKDIPTFTTSSHTMEANPRAIVKFLTDEKYAPLQKPGQGPGDQGPQQAKQGGFRKEYHNGGRGPGHPHAVEEWPDPSQGNISGQFEKIAAQTKKTDWEIQLEQQQTNRTINQANAWEGETPQKGENNMFGNLFSKNPIDNWQESGLDDWSHMETWDEAYNAAKKWAVHMSNNNYEFTWNGQHKTVDYAGTPEQELGTYGIKDALGNMIHETDDETTVVNKWAGLTWNGFENTNYLPGHIASYNYQNPSIFIDWAHFRKGSSSTTIKDGKTTGSQTMVFGVEQKQYLKTHLQLQKLTSRELKQQGVLGGTIYKAGEGKDMKGKIKTWQDFHDAIEAGDIVGNEAYNFLTNNCADVTADGFALDMNGKKVCRVLGMVDSPAKVLDAIKAGFPTMDITGRDSHAYDELYRNANYSLKGKDYNAVLQNAWALVNGNDKEKSIGYIQEALVGLGYKLPKSTTKAGNMDQQWGDETQKQLAKWEKESGNNVRANKMKLHEGGFGKPGDSGYIPPVGTNGHTHPHKSGNTESVTTSKSNSYSNLQNSLAKKGYTVNQTGTFNTQTLEATYDYGNNHLTHLPEWNTDWKWDKIGCTGQSCSEQTTDMLQMLFPQSLQIGQDDPNMQAGAAHSWYRQGYMMDHGGQNIWSQQAIGTFTADGKEIGTTNKSERFPPMEVWNTFNVGDVVHLGSGTGDMRHMGERDRKGGKKAGYDQSTNTGTGHTGFIVGRDPSTGVPLIMHGVSGKMYVERIDQINWEGGEERDDALAYDQPNYFIQGVTRPPGLVNSDEKANFGVIAGFVQENVKQVTSYDINSEYYENLDKEQKKSATFFTDYLSGNINFNRDYMPRQEDYEGDAEGYNIAMEKYLAFKTENNTFDENDLEGTYAKSRENSPISRISRLTGYTEEAVSHAASLLYGTYMTETGDPGMFGSEQKGMLMTWVKDNVPKSLLGMVFDESQVTSPPSEGIMRIKVDWQVENQDGSMTQLGRWYEKSGLIYKDEEGNWINGLTAGDDLGSGISGKRGMSNSIDAGILQFLHYQQKLKRGPKYNYEDNTYDGVPLDYVAASMHVHPESVNKEKLFNYMEEGDRNYSNSVMLYASMLTTNTTAVDFDDDHEYVGSKTTSANAAEQGATFMTSKTNSIFKDQTGGKSFFSKGNSDQAKILRELNGIGEGENVQAQIMIDKLRYGIKLKADNPGYADSKILELVDEKFQVIQIPQDYKDENNTDYWEEMDNLNMRLIDKGLKPINVFHSGMKI